MAFGLRITRTYQAGGRFWQVAACPDTFKQIDRLPVPDGRLIVQSLYDNRQEAETGLARLTELLTIQEQETG